MLIQIKELPILKESKIVGKLQGLVYDGEKVFSIYCKIRQFYYHIPMKDVVLCKDAVIIKNNYNEILDINEIEEIYNKYGEKVGYLKSIELLEDYSIKGIVVDDFFIGSEYILNFEPNIIINMSLEQIKSCEKIIKEELDLRYEKSEENLGESIDEIESNTEIDDLESTVDINENEEKSEEELKVLNILNIEEEKSIFDAPTEVSNLEQDIIIKYKYLCHKKLEDNIKIGDEEFKVGAIVDTTLIEKAINNNEIVKLVMAAEE